MLNRSAASPEIRKYCHGQHAPRAADPKLGEVRTKGHKLCFVDLRNSEQIKLVRSLMLWLQRWLMTSSSTGVPSGQAGDSDKPDDVHFPRQAHLTDGVTISHRGKRAADLIFCSDT